MNDLHINGWIGFDNDGNIGVSKINSENTWDYTSIAKLIENFARDYWNGAKLEYKRGLGGSRSIIEDTNIVIYYSDKKCNIDQITESLLLTLDGELTTDIALTGYSEYTITGYNVVDFSIGGHDLESEISQHEHQYMHFILNCTY